MRFKTLLRQKKREVENTRLNTLQSQLPVIRKKRSSQTLNDKEIKISKMNYNPQQPNEKQNAPMSLYFKRQFASLGPKVESA